ncbi:MAG: hypothetical protein HOW73_01660 [Polyangiaceae bacterium]|nr:hypothetical protein [Polyangiaceae bacterium]
MNTRTFLIPVLSMFSAAAIACGAGQDDQGGGGDTANGGNNSNGGSTANFGTDGGGGQGEGAGFADGGGTSVGGGCAGDDFTAEKVPLDMYIMQDQSGSMSDPPAGGSGTRWDAVVAAISEFVNQDEAAGVGVGIQYFPLESGANCNTAQCMSDGDCGAGCGPCEIPPGFPFGICSGFGATDSCTALDYSTPDVEIGVLPGNANAIIASMNAHGPTGGTPTSAALQGAIDHARAWAGGNPGHATIVVLATDGDPTSCETDLAAINAIAAAGANGSPPVLTFVIGVGGSVGALNGIAQAGGTNQAFMIDQDPDVQQAFLDALNTIQGQAIPCAFLIPEPPPGEDINFDEVNVHYTPSEGMAGNIPYVESEAQCPASGLAWHYDDPANPTQIVLCPGACSTISADTGGVVKIVVGCTTYVP